MVRFYLITGGLWVCSNSICLRLLGRHCVVKLQLINLRYLLLLWPHRLLRLRRLLQLRRLLRPLPSSLCEGSLLYYAMFLYFPVCCSFPRSLMLKSFAYLLMFQNRKSQPKIIKQVIKLTIKQNKWVASLKALSLTSSSRTMNTLINLHGNQRQSGIYSTTCSTKCS